MNPELRKRFIDSLDYLRGMGFFQDYSRLSSEEILEKIFSGEINYMYWWREWGKERHPAPLWGRILRKSIERDENSWMKSSNAEIDYCIIPFDTKRAIEEDIETMLGDGLGITMLKKYAKISRGVFQPTSISEKYSCPDPELGEEWTSYEVYFTFRDKRYNIKIILKIDYFHDLGLEKVNELIKNTGYQYYRINTEPVLVVVLTKEEAGKLEKERGWRFIPV